MSDKGTAILCAACLIGIAVIIELSAPINSTTVFFRYALIGAAGACAVSVYGKGR